jgi:ribosomal protein S18 acetylase RimI-like enzyme
VAADPGDSPYRIRVGTADEAAVAARLHAQQITTGFLSSLGPAFLEHLYRRVALWDGGLLLVAIEDAPDAGPGGGEVVGFIASADPTSGLYRQFLRHDAVGAALATVVPLLRSWPKVVETLRHGSSASPGVGRGPEVLAMAVDAGSQGKGLGRRLVLGFLDAVVAGGGSEGYTVIAQDNEPSLALYRRCGFGPTEVFELHAGTASVVMQWDRTPDGGPGVPGPT